jgi:hypothetical protein
MLFYGFEAAPSVFYYFSAILVFILSYAYIETLFNLYFGLKLLSLKPEVTQNQWIANFKSKIFG